MRIGAVPSVTSQLLTDPTPNPLPRGAESHSYFETLHTHRRSKGFLPPGQELVRLAVAEAVDFERRGRGHLRLVEGASEASDCGGTQRQARGTVPLGRELGL